MALETLRSSRTRRVGFTSLTEETRVEKLPALGELPGWLSGTLVRVTPALLDVAGTAIRHWFDGIAMLNAFSFTGGEVAYASRFLDTDARAAARAGDIDVVGFATDPCRSLFKRTAAMFGSNPNDNCNVNLAQLGERYLAMTEVPLPVEFDAATLDTLGLVKWQDRLGGRITTAHPHFDPQRGELVNYVAHLSARSSYRIFAVAEGSTQRRQIASIPVKEPAYMHSFGMSERYVIITEFPLVVNPLNLVFSGKPFIHSFRWAPDRGTRVIVVDRHSGDLCGIYETDPFFAFHHVNAFERGNDLVLDIVVHDDGPAAIDALEVDRLRSAADPVRNTRLRRFTVPLGGGQISNEALADVDMELPRINYRRANTHEYAYAYASAMRSEGSDWYDQLVKIDVGTGETRQWSQPDCYPGEPVFVARPGERTEDDGVLLSVVLDAAAKRSFLLVVDAVSMEEEARAEVPHHIPFGFHGQYFESVN